MSGTFSLKLLDARWIAESETDLCAHGTVRVELGPSDVTVDDLNVAFGARGVLRTIDEERRADKVDPLFPHACHFVMGCPNIAIDWSVRHESGNVLIGDLTARPAEAEPTAAAPIVVVSLDRYREAAMEFARAVRGFYGPPGRKVIVEAWERPLFDEFWVDFDALFAQHDRST